MKLTLLILSGIVLPLVMLNNSPILAAENNSSMAAGSVIDTTISPVLPIATAQVAVRSSADRTATALPTSAALTLNSFAATLKNGDAGKVVGVYVSGVLALRVAQQPINNPAYVNSIAGYATQFRLAEKYGSTGLLAHNYLSGALFSNLMVGQQVDVIYGDGLIRRYTISIIRRLQALRPTSAASNFVDIDNGDGAQITNADLFSQIYGEGDRVIFQTCIDAYGNTSWGRLFVIATPIS